MFFDPSAVVLKGAARLCAVLEARACDNLVRVKRKLRVDVATADCTCVTFNFSVYFKKSFKIVLTCCERVAAAILITF